MSTRIVFTTEGGFAHLPGRSIPVTLELDALPDADRARIHGLIEAAHFWTAAGAPAGAPSPDARTYTLTVEEDTRRCTHRIDEPVTDPRMHDLLQAVRELLARR